jgi:poly(ADP-ribose) glycohydrolase
MSIMREINKAFVGFDKGFLVDKSFPICTSKWGCGLTFGGDEVLKFLIQWIAASVAKREMIYIVSSKEKMDEYQIMAKELSSYKTLDLL